MTDNGKLSVSQLAKRYGRDRATITNLLKGVPFSTGKHGAHLYDAAVAAAAIESVASNRESIVSEKLRQLKAQNELLEKLRSLLIREAETVSGIHSLRIVNRRHGSEFFPQRFPPELAEVCIPQTVQVAQDRVLLALA